MSPTFESSGPELPQQLRDHDPAAWEGLYGYRERLRITLTRKFGAFIPPEDVEDLIQETLLRAFLTGERYQPALGSIWTWLNMLAHYQALSFLRTQLPTHTLDALAEAVAGQLEAGRPPACPEPSLAMEHLLQSLAPQQAELIRLHYYDGWTYQDLAEAFALRESTIESRLSRARQQLRRQVHRNARGTMADGPAHRRNNQEPR